MKETELIILQQLKMKKVKFKKLLPGDVYIYVQPRTEEPELFQRSYTTSNEVSSMNDGRICCCENENEECFKLTLK